MWPLLGQSAPYPMSADHVTHHVHDHSFLEQVIFRVACMKWTGSPERPSALFAALTEVLLLSSAG